MFVRRLSRLQDMLEARLIISTELRYQKPSKMDKESLNVLP